MAKGPNRRTFLRTLGLSAASITLSPSAPLANPGPNLIRRNLPVSAASGIVAAPFLRMNSRYRNPNPRLIRPPGTLEEGVFLRRCLKCGECMKGLPYQWPPAYPNGGRLGGNLVSHPNPQIGILPVLLHPLWSGLPFRGHKKAHGEGKGSTEDRPGLHRQGSLSPLFPGDRLHRHVRNIPPTPKKAIWFIEGRVKNSGGIAKTVKQPIVGLELCIGCGICENKCPVVDKPTIVVTSIGESRSGVNRLILY